MLSWNSLAFSMNQQMLAIITDLKQMKKIESLNKEIEDIKRIEVKILEMKTTVTKIKNSVNGLKSRKKQGKESVKQKTEQ